MASTVPASYRKLDNPETLDDSTSAGGSGVVSQAVDMPTWIKASGGTEDERVMAEDGVGRALEGLARMERRLKRIVKRQKLELERSTVAAREDRPAEQAFIAQLARSIEDAATAGAVASAASCEKGGGRAGLDTSVVALRGAARPPPVNSDYLPLPWSGRLGYVRDTASA